MHRCQAAVMLSLIAAASACLPMPTTAEDDLAPEGEIVFQYDGDRRGAFRARGAVQNELPNGVRYGTWSAAFFNPGSERIRLIGFDSTRAPAGRIVEIRLGRHTGGEVRVDAELCPSSDAGCPSIHFDLSGTIDRLRSGEWSPAAYRSVRGRIELHEVTPGHMTGRFEAELESADGSGRELRIDRGSFNVPVLYPDLH